MQKLTNLLFELLAIILEKHRGLYLPLAFKEYFHKRSNIHNYETRHVNDLNLTNNRKSFLDHSIQTCGPILWNTLPTAIKDSKSVNHFRNQFNPNSIRSYKIVQKLSPKHAARGVAQSPYPIYRHGKASLSEQPPMACSWGSLPSTRQVLGSSPGPGGRAARAFFSTLPSFLLREIVLFRTFPTQPTVRLGLNNTSGWVHHNPNSSRSYKNYLQNTQHVVLRNRPTLSIGTERLACLNNPHGVQLGTLAQHVAGPGFEPRTRRARCARFFFSTLPSFLLREIVLFRTFPTQPTVRLGLNIKLFKPMYKQN